MADKGSKKSRKDDSSKKDDTTEVRLLDDSSTSRADLASLIEHSVNKAITVAMGKLYSEIKELKTHVTTLDLKLSSATNDICSSVEDLAERVSSNESQLSDLTHQRAADHQTLKELKSNLVVLDSTMVQYASKISRLSKLNNDLDQQSRLLNLRVTGLIVQPQMAEKEVLSFIRDKLNYIDIIPEDIVNVVVISKNPTPGEHYRTSSLIVSFARRTLRDAILRLRRQLKGTKVGISEDLIPINAHFVSTNRKDPRIFKIWSWSGRIFATMTKDGPKKLLDSTLPLEGQLPAM